MKRCKQRVYRGRAMTYSTCDRPAGHGPNGGYCAQHALRLDESEAALCLWERTVDWAPPRKIRVRSFNEKTYVSEGGRRHPRKSRYSAMYETEYDALQSLREVLAGKVEHAKAEMRDASALLKTIEAKLKGKRT